MMLHKFLVRKSHCCAKVEFARHCITNIYAWLCRTCWSKKMSLRSRLALNMKTLECILISVIELAGSECATATKPTFWYDGSKVAADDALAVADEEEGTPRSGEASAWR